jgi:hypothetical protein
MRGLTRLALVVSAVLVGNVAWGQTTMPPDDRTFDVLLFDPALGTHSFLTVSGADLLDAKQFELMLGVFYMTDPLTVYNVDSSNNLTTRTSVVSSVFAGYLSGAYGITRDVMVGAKLPGIFSLRGDGLDVNTGMGTPGGLKVSGLGDLELELTGRVLHEQAFSLALTAAGTLPTSKSFGSDGTGFIGDTLPTFRPRIAVEYSAGKIGFGANLGAIFRSPRKLYSSEVGQQLTYGAALAYHFTQRFDVMGEVFGRSGFNTSLDEAPLEGDLAVRIGASPVVTVMVGGGAGLVKGVGSPGLRVFAALTYAPAYGDRDGDGIPDAYDKCPDEPEDKDGFQDEDGCPDPDNDNDGIPDNLDKCPNDPEDKDGFQDEDGCPDLDNDKDGIPDDKDACPNEAGPPENHGCPPGKTGVAEVAPIATPTPAPEVEIVPGGATGAPGVPAPAPRPAPGATGKVIFTGPIEFAGARPRHSAHGLLNDAAQEMKLAREVRRWRVTVVAEPQRTEAKRTQLAQSRASAIKAYLVSKGVRGSLIETFASSNGPVGVTISSVEATGPAPKEEEPVIDVTP